MFHAISPLQSRMRARSALASKLERRDDPLAELPASVPQQYLGGQVVLVGYGRVGKRIGAALTEQGIPFVVAERNREIVERLRAQNIPAVAGDAAEPAVLIQAHITHARMLNPGIKSVVRTHSEDEAEMLRRDQVSKVLTGEHELALGMVRHVLQRMEKKSWRSGIDDKCLDA